LKLDLTLETKRGLRSLCFTYTRMVNAGYTGRNQEEVRRHVQELAEKGIPGPGSVPVLFAVVPQALVVEDDIEVYGSETSGEVEYALCLVDEDEVYVAIGSDHTDRHLEESDIPRSKQICPNIMSSTVWPLGEIADHWDDVIMRAVVSDGGRDILYQEGSLGLLMNPSDLISFVKSKIPGPLEDMLIFSGTMGTLTGGFVYGQRFHGELVDELLGRRLHVSYDVRPLDYLLED